MGSVAPDSLDVSALPVAALRGADLGSSGVTAVLETTGLLADGGEATHFAVVVLGGANPVDLGVAADSLVGGVNQDHFVELVGGILSNPVGVQDTEVATTAGDTLLSDVLVGLGLLLLSDTLVAGLTVDAALADQSLTATTADLASVDNVSLLLLESEGSSFIES